MGIGRHVRGLFGKHERWVSDFWRRGFVDLEVFARRIQQSIAQPARVLEIGCGEGAMTTRLARVYPRASITGIDISQTPGRLFSGDSGRVRFLQIAADQLLDRECGAYELVVIADVIHHVPREQRLGLLNAASKFVAPRGAVVFKDWARKPMPIHWANYCADRFLTGDRVHYLSENELRELATSAFGPGTVSEEFRVPPWDCNLAFIILPRSHATGR
jgi:2-polyprenyl-3-methyl-5-hydroxy-6-metoxy-1,4-benzoquinol methylase